MKFELILPNFHTAQILSNGLIHKQINLGEVLRIADCSSHKIGIENIEPFTLIDSYIDNQFPHLIGKSFSYKIKNFKHSTCIEEILINCYEILLVYRNASEHDRNSIHKDEKFLYINRELHSNDKLNISFYRLNLISSLAFLILSDCCMLNDLSDYLKETLYFSYYTDILKELTLFKNKYKSNIDFFIAHKYQLIPYKMRTNLTGIKFTANVSHIEFNPKRERTELVGSCYNYIFEYNKVKYLIPFEHTNLDNKILISKLTNYICT